MLKTTSSLIRSKKKKVKREKQRESVSETKRGFVSAFVVVGRAMFSRRGFIFSSLARVLRARARVCV